MPIWYTLKTLTHREGQTSAQNGNSAVYKHEIDLTKIQEHRTELLRVETGVQDTPDGIRVTVQETPIYEYVVMQFGGVYRLADGEWDEIKALLNDGQSRIGGTVRVVE